MPEPAYCGGRISQMVRLERSLVGAVSLIVTLVPASGVTVAYALTADASPRPNGTYRWGLLHDSDPLVGALTKLANPNYAVAFQLTVP